MNESQPPARPPMGRLDGIEAGSRTMTVQTEFFHRPSWRIETKIYVAGELKKVHTDDVAGISEEELQSRLNQFHQSKLHELEEKLRGIGR